MSGGGRMTLKHDPPLELEHWQLVDAVQEYCQKRVIGYRRMEEREQRLEAKRQLELFALRWWKSPDQEEPPREPDWCRHLPEHPIH